MNLTASRISDLRTLCLGDAVEVRRFNDVHYRGPVEAMSPRLGVAWIRDDATGNRVMLHAGAYEVFRLRAGLGVGISHAA
ncbi:hypothetical protein NCCP1664_16390 [Zafaria cholistanensis]|uniref:Uncharacterized protein n=1 Tax=Zafaria cholistanensis TaxID=1682741 RepID=A0A5A7NQL4_9MICC|nr:hypothetical protein [Zafaria cholistanensis]GER23143.1 hypothetical protein NCCP1664_16390 [Zafaria cholistanensis]